MSQQYGIKTSKKGIPVEKAVLSDQPFTSTNAGLKIFKIVDLSVKIASGTAAFTVTTVSKRHNFVGGTPAYLPFVLSNNIAYPIQLNLSISSVSFQFDSRINSSDITILIYNTDQPGSDIYIDFRVFIFTDLLA